MTRPSRRSLRGRGRRSPFRGERRRVRWGASSSRILQFDVVIPGSRGQIFQLREHGWRIQGWGALSAAAKHRRPGVLNDRRFSLLLTWQRASSGLPVTGASPSGPHLALVTPAGPSARTVALGLGLRRAQVSVGHAGAGGCALHPERVALHRSLVPSRPTAWLTGQVTSWGASCLLHLSWPSNPRALESGRAGES